MEKKLTTAATSQRYDVVLIGGGAMSTTLGTLIKELEPDWSIALYENLSQAGLESSDPWNNAGTGHAALCELNYAPMKNGVVNPAKALGINEQFQVSRQFWSYLVRNNYVQDPSTFINPLPHMSFVWGDDHAEYLRVRYEALSAQPLFEQMEHSEDPDTIGSWAPLLTQGRDRNQRIAASRVKDGTDVDFGALTQQLAGHLAKSGVDVHYEHKITDLSRANTGWDVSVTNNISGEKTKVHAKFVFIGAGGGALHLLQKTGIPESKGYGGFPVSGHFMRCFDENIINQHNAKVYGQASVGAPPMSVPHLDTRFVNGRRSLMFGPYAGFSTNFLKSGSLLDLPLSVRPHNLLPMLGVAKDNMSLVTYLVSELTKSKGRKFESLTEFFPEANPESWEMITAGQRVQVIKKGTDSAGVLQFGTEVITSADGTVGALLGASPGASTAAPIMVELLKRCFPNHAAGWAPKLTEIIPSYGQKLNENQALREEVLTETNRTLKLI
ncbi:malate:quinone oxidoreductase [Micrococcoides hystricis]|uniref:Probable malate:quinone oxidoreductase n=1 Tax=Micrococcoides hystricis TaxID=1572761 RepID=A0ABV6PCR2_9MICC